ncbi:hypothetical protein BH09SUM1_BH09SUM1_13850 [soil metagenome]
MIETLKKAALAAEFADEKKAHDIDILDVRGLCNFTDIFLICSGNNRVQLNAISDNIAERFKKLGLKAPIEDGHRTSNWVVLDYGDVVIHIMSQEARTFYRLGQLWGDAKPVEWTAPQAAAAGS